jgi:hypothetical protein
LQHHGWHDFGGRLVVGSKQFVERFRVRWWRDAGASPRLDMQRRIPLGTGWVLLIVLLRGGAAPG